MTSAGPESNQAAEALRSEGYREAVKLLRECAVAGHGFLATPTNQDNYRRVWGRDSCIAGLAALSTGEEDLARCCGDTLRTLATERGPHGEIPSNVDLETGRISYGGTTGRVDADLWFLIACAEYWRVTRDQGFLAEMRGAIREVQRLLGCWEFNNRGLLFVPPTGDWADEYVQSGYVLYDNVLYRHALCCLAALFREVEGRVDHELDEKCRRLKRLIRRNYWFDDCDADEDPDIYHRVLYQRGCRAAVHCRGRYWMPFFSPTGYGYRFDALANALTSLLGVAEDQQNACVDRYIREEVVDRETDLLPAFLPVITPKDEEWDDLQVTFTYEFKNAPYEYHNGGQWSMVTGFHAASLAQRGQREEALRFLDGVHRANRLAVDGQPWSFPEFVHGKTHEPGGVKRMAWSAAGAILAHCVLEGTPVLQDPMKGTSKNPRGRAG